MSAASQLHPLTWGREVILVFILSFGVEKKETNLSWSDSCLLPAPEQKRAVSVQKERGLLPKRNGSSQLVVGKEEEKGESTPKAFFQCSAVTSICGMKLQSLPVRLVRLIFNKLPIHQRGQPSSLSFLPLQYSPCHVTENVWDHSNSVSLPERHMTQQWLQCRLPMVVNKLSVWLCSFAMPCARCHRLADRSPLVYIWPLASRCNRKCCAVNVDEALLQEAVRANHQRCLRPDRTPQGGSMQQKFPNLSLKDQLHTTSS